MIKITVAADICPIERNQVMFSEGNAEAVFNDLLPELESADLSIANLECPFIERPSPIMKSGPVFGVEANCVNAIRSAGFDVLGLANNHILDHGPAGVNYTHNICREAGISTVGAGASLDEAGEMLVKEVGGLRVGILAMAEHEYSVATPSGGGASPLDLCAFVRTVKSNRDRFDFLVVLFHGGHEHYALPSPRVRDTCRFMVETGANAVFVQHPHRLCGHEIYRGAPIVYGQGALILDEVAFRDLKPFHQGMLVNLSIQDDLSAEVDFVPFTQADPDPGARKMEPQRASEALQEFQSTSAALQDDAYLEEQWLRFCNTQKHNYLSSLLGHGRLLDRLNRRGWVTRCFYLRRKIMGALHVTSCETHREILETIFRHDLY